MRSFIKYLGLSAACLPVFCGAACAANAKSRDTAPKPTHEARHDATREREKLAQVRERIAVLTGRLGSQLKDRDSLAARLRGADLELADKRRRLDELHAERATAQRRRDALTSQIAAGQAMLEEQRASFASEVRAAYIFGPRAEVKLLLNQSDPASAGRMAMFYGYFARQRSALIAAMGEQLADLQRLENDADATREQLQTLESQTSQDVTGLASARRERAAALSAVTHEVTSGNQQLIGLKREAQSEESLIASLANVMQEFPLDNKLNFDQLRGKLPWPVRGRLMGGAGPHAGGAAAGPLANGVLIEAAAGAKIRAPYFGRVVYADWLQGLGLLMIIGHGDGYMTLYGHAEVLYKKVGDSVSAGEVIAALSEAGGPAPQLYFEIREGRTPKEARTWLKPAG